MYFRSRAISRNNNVKQQRGGETSNPRNEHRDCREEGERDRAMWVNVIQGGLKSAIAQQRYTIIIVIIIASRVPRPRQIRGAGRERWRRSIGETWAARGAIRGSDLESTGAYFKIGMRERLQGHRVTFAVVYISALQR